MKIAIVTVNFAGSSSSLAEAHLLNGHEVDFYNVIFTSQHSLEFESFSLPSSPRGLGLHRVDSFATEGLRRFALYSDRFGFYNAVCLGMPRGRNLVDNVKRYVSLLVMRHVFGVFRDKHYDMINVIGQNSFSIHLSCMLKKWEMPVVHSIHEVLDNHLDNPNLYPGVEILINKDIRINVFSEKSAHDLQKVSSIPESQISTIPFGLFTGYREYNNVEIPELGGETDYILFYGYIEKYKGLDVLYEAVKQIGNLPAKVVVAGRGYQPIMERMKHDERFILISRWLGNAELTTLIRLCKCVVCPYLSASQSGIPQTVFNFDKPIIATDIESFEAVVHDGQNGVIVKRHNINELANSIRRMYDDDEMYTSMIGNIKRYRERESIVEWKSLANSYIKTLNGNEII